MHKIFFDFFVKPWHSGVHKEKILNELFETSMVPACPGWDNLNTFRGPAALSLGPCALCLFLGIHHLLGTERVALDRLAGVHFDDIVLDGDWIDSQRPRRRCFDNISGNIKG